MGQHISEEWEGLRKCRQTSGRQGNNLKTEAEVRMWRQAAECQLPGAGGRILPRCPSGGLYSANILLRCSDPMKLMLTIWPPEPWENEFLLLQITKSVAICGSHREPTQLVSGWVRALNLSNLSIFNFTNAQALWFLALCQFQSHYRKINKLFKSKLLLLPIFWWLEDMCDGRC